MERHLRRDKQEFSVTQCEHHKLTFHFQNKIKRGQSREAQIRSFSSRLQRLGERQHTKRFFECSIRQEGLFSSLAAHLGFGLRCADIKAAYLQCGLVSRELFLRPSRQCKIKRGHVWKLIELPQGISEADRLWAKTIKTWMTQSALFNYVTKSSQLYVKKDRTGRIILLLVKLTSNLLLAGEPDSIKSFAEYKNNLRLEKWL